MSEVKSHNGPLHVLIIGAGASGLAIGQGLKKNGISFAIYDKESERGRVRDWGMAYFWSSTFVSDLLPQPVLNNLKLAEVDYGLTGPDGRAHGYVGVRNTQTGELMTKLATPGGRRVSRRRFRQILRQGLDVNFDKNVTNIIYPSSGVIVEFDDGSTTSGTLVIGADGGSSKIRRLLLGAKAESEILPYVMNNFNMRYTAEQALEIRGGLCEFTDYGVHPKGMFFVMSIREVPDPNDPSTWSFQLLTSWPESLRGLTGVGGSEERLKALRELTADFEPTRKNAIAWVPDGTHIPQDRLAIWSPVSWDHHNGRVTLVGDAAHAMTYHRGQGLNNCINDAANLVAGLIDVRDGKRGIDEMLTAYGAEVVERGAAEVAMSRDQTEKIHVWNQFMETPFMKHGLAGQADLKKLEVEDVASKL